AALSCHAVEAVRGILATCHAFLTSPVTEKDLWRVYRDAYGKEPFVRIVKEAQGLYRLPEPKILAGTNYCDVGFALDEHARGVVSRYTDKETMEVFTMALAGKLNTAIVARLQALGAPAVGLSGVDGGLLTGRRKEAVRAVDNGRVLLVKDDYSGTVEQVNAGL